MSLLNLAAKYFEVQTKAIDSPEVPIYSQWGLGALEEFSTLLGLSKGEKLDFLNQYSEHVWVYVSTFDVSEAAASIPWKLFSRKDPASEITEHALLDLIRKPNSHVSAHDFMFAIYADMSLHGNSFEYLVGSKPNDTVSMQNPPEFMFRLIPDRVTIKRGQVRPIDKYAYKVDGEVRAIFEPVEIIHPKYFNPKDDALGQSTVDVLKATLLEDKHASQFAATFSKNSMVPTGVFQTDKNLTDTQFKRIKKQLDEKYKGATKSHKTLLLEAGTTWQSIAMSPKDVEFLNQNKANREKVLAAFGEPPTIAGLETANFAQSRVYEQTFWTKTIIPNVNRVIDTFNLAVCPFYGEDLFFQADTSGIQALHETFTDTREFIKALVDIVITKNEARMILSTNFGHDLPPVKEGNTLYIGANLIPVGDVAGEKALISKEDEQELLEDRERSKKFVSLRDKI